MSALLKDIDIKLFRTQLQFSSPQSPSRLPFQSPSSSFHSRGSAWPSHGFKLGAGIVLIQRLTHKVVMVYNDERRSWFFPCGRKDVGESLEQTALREAFEESGYRAQFLPLRNPTRQPAATHLSGSQLNTEPLFVTTAPWEPKYHNGRLYDGGGEYFITWYAGQIAEDAVRVIGSGMPHEHAYRSYLLTYEDALQRASSRDRLVLEYVWSIYTETLSHDSNPQRPD